MNKMYAKGKLINARAQKLILHVYVRALILSGKTARTNQIGLRHKNNSRTS